jgi:uncharacterized protein
MAELSRPGRDPREKFEYFSFTEGVNEISDLKVGMKLPGKVTNITKFGAFVDIGVHQDGLVHLSQLANRYIKDPNEVVSVNQTVEVTITEIDVARKRIALSMKKDEVETVKQMKKAGVTNEKRAGEKPKNTNSKLSNTGNKKVERPVKKESMDSKLAALLKKFS